MRVERGWGALVVVADPEAAACGDAAMHPAPCGAFSARSACSLATDKRG